jgi:CheY-like chemotaxis protein
MQHRIFDLFAQVDPSPTRSQGGLGIGLTLVKTLVEMHGGAVRAASAGAGRGSEFTIRLPLAISAAKTLAPAQPPDRPLPTLRVLVVDDNHSASHLVSRLLAKLGQQVRIADSATQALTLVSEFQPDLVISDIAMPGISGYELAAEIQALKLAQPPVLIALTGYGQESDRQESAAAGFYQHLTKPIGLTGLEHLLASVGALRAETLAAAK